LGALVGLAFVAASFVVQWNQIYANHQVIDEVMEHVERIREERGLSGEAKSAVGGANSTM
jgi:hypothetical protein